MTTNVKMHDYRPSLRQPLSLSLSSWFIYCGLYVMYYLIGLQVLRHHGGRVHSSCLASLEPGHSSFRIISGKSKLKFPLSQAIGHKLLSCAVVGRLKIGGQNLFLE